MASSRSLGTLSLDIIAKVGGFVDGMSKAERAAKRSGASIAGVATKIGKAFAALAAPTALVYFTDKAIDAADAVRDLSIQTGASTEFLSEIAYAAEQSGTSLDKVGTSLVKMSRSAVDAVQNITGPAAMAFDKLGVSIKDADGNLKTSEELFTDVAEALSGFEDGMGKAALIQAIFGRGAAEITELLNKGEEGLRASAEQAQAWGLTVTAATADAADAFKDNLGDMQKIRAGFFQQFSAAILPGLAEISEVFVDDWGDALEESGDLIILWGDLFLRTIAVVLDAGSLLGKGFATVGGTALTGVKQTYFAVTGQFEKMFRAGEEWAAAEGKRWGDLANDPNFAKYQRMLEDLRNGMVKRKKIPKIKLEEIEFIDEAAAAKARDAQAAALAQLQQMEGALEQQIATYEKGETAVVAYSVAHGELATTLETAGAAAGNIGNRLVAHTALLEVMKIKTKAVADAEAARLKTAEAIAAQIEANFTPEEALAAERKRLADLLGTGLPVEEYDKGIKRAEDEYKKSFDRLTIFTEQASRNVQDIIAQNLIDGFDEGVDGMLKAFARMIQEMLAQAIAADIARALFGDEVGSGGGLFGKAGGFLRDLFRAEGGPVAAGRTYVVGERGPELFTPGASGGITPLATTGGVAITQNNYISGSNLGPERMTRILEENNKKLKGEFLQELRRGAYA